MSLCIDPPALIVCVNKAASFYGRLSASENFCVNVLSFSQLEISKAFSGGRLKGIERFATGNWRIACGSPHLIGAHANLFCKTETVKHFGTHGIFIGRVEHVQFDEEVAPLVYQDGHYVRTFPCPGGPT
jgi:flavin reductase (DIM6/NTAB) family NADH-FMN oxidoreductase RutF